MNEEDLVYLSLDPLSDSCTNTGRARLIRTRLNYLMIPVILKYVLHSANSWYELWSQDW